MTGGITRAEAAADTIRQQILVGDYLSGERLIEVKIAQVLNVSQNTIRDALRILESEGWVVKHPRHGVYVRSFTAAEAAEVCAVLAAVEALMLTWAMMTMDKLARADLHTALLAARKAAYIGDAAAAFDHLLTFHGRIVAAANRPLTQRVLESLYNQVRLLDTLRQARAPRSLRELERYITAHEAMLRHIDAGEVEAACAILRQHTTDYGAAIAAALRLET